MKISVATPTYNRANTLDRVFNSLMSQTFKDFEWIIVDDGSNDDTKELIDSYKKQASFDIKYFYQENNGMHTALNKALEFANGEFFIICHSDDSFLPESFEILLKYWNLIDDTKKNEFRGITCRRYDPDTMLPSGKAFSIDNDYIDMLGLDAFFKAKFNFEMWGMNRTDVMKEYTFPDIRGGANKGLTFFPETIIWNKMGRKYKVRFINYPLTAYYRDQANSISHRSKSRSRANIYLWEHYLNDVFDYFGSDPMLFVKASVGLSMDGFLLGLTNLEILNKPNRLITKFLVLMFMPAGYMLSKKKSQH